MRWLFLFLFVLNLAYIGWQLMMPATETYADVAPLKNVRPIVLLSENSPGEKPASMSETLAVKDNAGSSVHDEAAVVTEQVVVDPVVVEPETGEAAAASVVAEVSVPEPESSPDNCYTLGPFRDLDDLRRLTREIKPYVTATDFRGKEEKEQSLYWVYIKPEKNRAQAVATGKRLKAKRIKDFYVIRDGEKINGLSLGHFRNKKGAYGLMKRVKKLGFDVVIEPVFKVYTVYWLDYQLAAGESVPESVFSQVIKPGSRAKISRLSRDCGT